MLRIIRFTIFISTITICIDFCHLSLLLTEEIKDRNNKETVHSIVENVMTYYNLNISQEIIAFINNIDDEILNALIKNERITDGNSEEMISKVNKLSYDGLTTNQNVALCEEGKILKDRGTNAKSSILLADGDLGLYHENDKKELKWKLINEEKISFNKACEEIMKNANYNIYLIDNEIGFYNVVHNIDNVFYKIMKLNGMEHDESYDLIDFNGLAEMIFKERRIPIIGSEYNQILDNKIIFGSDKYYFQSIPDISMVVDEEKELKSILLDEYKYIENLKNDVKIEKKTDDGFINVGYDGKGILCFDEVGEYICTVEIKGNNSKEIKFNIIVNNKCQYIKYILWVISAIGILCVIYLVIRSPRQKTTKKRY